MTTLTELVANTRHLEELQLKKIQILRQLTYCVALKLNGVEQKDVKRIIRETTRLTREMVDGELKRVQVDMIEWSTGNVKPGFSLTIKTTNQIVGVVLNDGKVIKFECPIDGWK